MDALPRFQQLARRRIQLAQNGRHKFVHPLEPTDLINAKSWTSNGPYVKDKDPDHVPLPFVALRTEQLPDGYGFDKYGLLVPEDQAIGRSCQGPVAGVQDHGVHMMHPSHTRPSIETAGEPRRSGTGATDASTPDRAGIASTPNSVSPQGTPETGRTSVTGDLPVKTDGQGTNRDINRDTTPSLRCVTSARTPLRRSLREAAKEDHIRL